MALILYGEFISFIKNNPEKGKEYLDIAQSAQSKGLGFIEKQSRNENKELKFHSDILFTEETTVIHISGNKESSGRVLKVSQGLMKTFGFNKTEVVGHNISFLMP